MINDGDLQRVGNTEDDDEIKLRRYIRHMDMKSDFTSHTYNNIIMSKKLQRESAFIFVVVDGGWWWMVGVSS